MESKSYIDALRAQEKSRHQKNPFVKLLIWFAYRKELAIIDSEIAQYLDAKSQKELNTPQMKRWENFRRNRPTKSILQLKEDFALGLDSEKNS